MAKVGRPSGYSLELVEKICEQLCCGRGLDAILAEPGMPDPSTVYAWLLRFPEFTQMYTRAREIQAEVLAAQILTLSDTVRLGERIKRTTCEKCGGSGMLVDGETESACVPCGGQGVITETITADMVERTKVQIDARKWYACHLAPHKYGPHQAEPAAAGATTINVVVMQAGQRPAKQIEAAKEGE